MRSAFLFVLLSIGCTQETAATPPDLGESAPTGDLGISSNARATLDGRWFCSEPSGDYIWVNFLEPEPNESLLFVLDGHSADGWCRKIANVEIVAMAGPLSFSFVLHHLVPAGEFDYDLDSVPVDLAAAEAKWTLAVKGPVTSSFTDLCWKCGGDDCVSVAKGAVLPPSDPRPCDPTFAGLDGGPRTPTDLAIGCRDFRDCPQYVPVCSNGQCIAAFDMATADR